MIHGLSDKTTNLDTNGFRIGDYLIEKSIYVRKIVLEMTSCPIVDYAFIHRLLLRGHLLVLPFTVPLQPYPISPSHYNLGSL